MLLRNLLCLTLGCVTTSAFADTVWLKNGDRLTGKVKVLDGGKLMLETDYGGSIPLDWSKVATLESETPMLVRQDEFEDAQLANSLHKGDDGKVGVPTPTPTTTTSPSRPRRSTACGGTTATANTTARAATASPPPTTTNWNTRSIASSPSSGSGRAASTTRTTRSRTWRASAPSVPALATSSGTTSWAPSR
jgi:hypothetical protein